MDMSSSEAMPPQTLRIIDASLNRIGEGLRVLEDISRLVLDDRALTQQLKTMRHEMVRVSRTLNSRLIKARNSEGDVGIDLEVTGEGKRGELPEVVVANARRVQESMRVMEELAELPGVGLDSEKFKHARFSLYTMEKTLLSGLLHHND